MCVCVCVLFYLTLGDLIETQGVCVCACMCAHVRPSTCVQNNPHPTLLPSILHTFPLFPPQCPGGQVQDGSRRVPEELPLAHRRHGRPGPPAVEGPQELWLEGQGVLPLVPPAQASGRLHQVRAMDTSTHAGIYTGMCWGAGATTQTHPVVIPMMHVAFTQALTLA